MLCAFLGERTTRGLGGGWPGARARRPASLLWGQGSQLAKVLSLPLLSPQALLRPLSATVEPLPLHSGSPPTDNSGPLSSPAPGQPGRDPGHQPPRAALGKTPILQTGTLRAGGAERAARYTAACHTGALPNSPGACLLPPHWASRHIGFSPLKVLLLNQRCVLLSMVSSCRGNSGHQQVETSH